MSNRKINAEKPEVKYSMFYPKSTRLLYLDYPELRDIPEIKDLGKYCIFVWFLACRVSPLFEVDDIKERTQLAIQESNIKLNTKEFDDLISGNYSEIITEGIRKMETFKIGPRIRSMLIVEKMLTNFEMLSKVDIIGGDSKENKEYVDNCIKIQQAIPGLIRQAEQGFSTHELSKGKEEKEVSSIIDNWHNETA